ncbi:MAG: PilT/PilU family type 4a pilus ATPase [Ruthenibacterium sp.]
MEVQEILRSAVERDASDIFIIAGLPLVYKVNGHQQRDPEPMMRPRDTAALIGAIYELCGRDKQRIEKEDADDDFSFSVPQLGRFRANVLHQRGSLAAVIRVIRFTLPAPERMHIPPEVMRAAQLKKGLVLVTGPAGSGKSTTLACLIHAINHTREAHIITMEDPIEYIHGHKKCIVTQREILSDTPSYVSALRSALRESPDIILLGEMRDYETIEVAMTAAETGQLLFSTLHTTGAASTVDRIIDVFPANQQAQVRLQLSMVLEGVVSQQLVEAVTGEQVPVFEIMFTNPAIKNLIREAKTYQIDSAIQNGMECGMRTMDASLLKLVQDGIITKETALTHCIHYEMMEKRLKEIK